MDAEQVKADKLGLFDEDVSRLQGERDRLAARIAEIDDELAVMRKLRSAMQAVKVK